MASGTDQDKQNLGGWLVAMQESFIETGTRDSRTMLKQFDSGFGLAGAQDLMHNWAGLGGMIGFPEIGDLARRIEDNITQSQPAPQDEVRNLLVQLSESFALARPGESEKPRFPSELLDSLKGKRIALVGLAEPIARQLSAMLGDLHASSRTFSAEQLGPSADVLRAFEVAIFQVSLAAGGAPWPDPKFLNRIPIPAVLAGDRDLLAQLAPMLDASRQDILVEPWRPDEAIMRTWMIFTRSARRTEITGRRRAQERFKVVVADDDPTVATLVHKTLENYGMECTLALDGVKALELIRLHRPDAVVLDVNMPDRDGFDVLSTMRDDPRLRGTKVLLLTARRREADVLRGFGLGADDYVIKPFSPMELVARIGRLLRGGS